MQSLGQSVGGILNRPIDAPAHGLEIRSLWAEVAFFLNPLYQTIPVIHLGDPIFSMPPPRHPNGFGAIDGFGGRIPLFPLQGHFHIQQVRVDLSLKRGSAGEFGIGTHLSVQLSHAD